MPDDARFRAFLSVFLMKILLNSVTGFETFAQLGGIKGTFPHGHDFSTFGGTSFEHCYRLCLYSLVCSSITWASQVQRCYLNKAGTPGELLTSRDTVYMPVVGNNIQGHPCVVRPCSEEYICVPVTQATSYICLPIAPSAAVADTTTTAKAATVAASPSLPTSIQPLTSVLTSPATSITATTVLATLTSAPVVATESPLTTSPSSSSSSTTTTPVTSTGTATSSLATPSNTTVTNTTPTEPTTTNTNSNTTSTTTTTTTNTNSNTTSTTTTTTTNTNSNTTSTTTTTTTNTNSNTTSTTTTTNTTTTPTTSTTSKTTTPTTTTPTTTTTTPTTTTTTPTTMTTTTTTTAPDLSCTTIFDCGTLGGAECLDGKCTCTIGYGMDPRQGSCRDMGECPEFDTKFTPFSGYYIGGLDLKTLLAAGLAECIAACVNDPLCKTFELFDGNCYTQTQLWNDALDKGEYPGVNHYQRNCIWK